VEEKKTYQDSRGMKRHLLSMLFSRSVWQK